MNPLPNLKVTISKTADGSNDYMQIVSDDQFAMNIVLIAGKIEVADSRPTEKPKRGRK